MLAFLLSLGVLFGWMYFFGNPQLEANRQRVEREKAAAQAQQQPNAQTQPAAKAPEVIALVPRADALKTSPRLAVETPSLKGSIALKGGLIDDLSLVKHRETADPKSPNIVLFSPFNTANAYFARYGWTSSNAATKLPDSETVWTAESTGPLTNTSPAKLSWDNGQGLLFKRTIAVDQNYMFSVTDEVENKTAGDVAITPYARLFKFGSPSVAAIWIQHEGFLGVPGDDGLKEITYATAVDEGGSRSNHDGKTGGWVGITDKYWAAALVPDQKTKYTAVFEGEKGPTPDRDKFLAEYVHEPAIVPAGGKTSHATKLYAGAKQAEVVEAYEKDLGIEKFDLMIDWGWFYFITKPMNHAMHWLYGLLGNYGWAIIALTVVIKLIFFPLANKSYVSMAKMKKLQPQMESLKARFKDDKPRMQQELMKLYQEEKINPLAGCLPILVQIPVFFALYKVLFVSIDMRHAPFVGWIKDLSAPDPTSIFNLFGLLPFDPPSLLMVGIWPLIMGITMWVQMQLNPPQPDPVQQQIFSWMPLMFTFLLASFPAGLVIYWAWNNILSIIQQWYITKQQGAEIHLMDNFKRTFGPLIGLFSKTPPDVKK
jgi:YidC/Oxa1 family membrane protein insertase